MTVQNVEDAKPLADALLAGGINAVKLHACWLRGDENVADNYGEMLVMAGTVLTPTQARQVQDAGATCAVAPGMNPIVLQAAIELSYPSRQVSRL